MYLCAAVSGCVKDAPPSSPSPPGISGSSLSDTPSHNWSPETAKTDEMIEDVKLNNMNHSVVE